MLLQPFFSQPRLDDRTSSRFREEICPLRTACTLRHQLSRRPGRERSELLHHRELVGYSPRTLHDTPMSPGAFEAQLKLVPPDYEINVRDSDDIRMFADLLRATRGGYGTAGTVVDVRFRIRCGSDSPKDQWLYSDAQGDAIVGGVAFDNRAGYWVGDFLRRLEASGF